MLDRLDLAGRVCLRSLMNVSVMAVTLLIRR